MPRYPYVAHQPPGFNYGQQHQPLSQPAPEINTSFENRRVESSPDSLRSARLKSGAQNNYSPIADALQVAYSADRGQFNLDEAVKYVSREWSKIHRQYSEGNFEFNCLLYRFYFDVVSICIGSNKLIRWYSSETSVQC